MEKTGREVPDFGWVYADKGFVRKWREKARKVERGTRLRVAEACKGGEVSNLKGS